MKKTCYSTIAFVCLSLFTTTANAQLGTGSMNTLTDGNGNPILSKKAGPSGTAYLFNKNYLDGVLFLVDSEKPVSGSKFKLNLQDSKLYYMDAMGSEMEVASPVRRIEFTGAGPDHTNVVFAKGFPTVDNLTKDNFYQVLVSGKALLLMDIKFSEVEYKEYNSASTTYRTDKLQRYYGAMGNRIVKLAKPEDLLLLLSDKTSQISDYIKKENIKVKKQADLEKVFDYYNKL